MATLKDVMDRVTSIKIASELFGASIEFDLECSRRVSALAAAICGEQGLTPDEAVNLPKETLLGQTSEALFRELLAWLATQHDMFKK